MNFARSDQGSLRAVMALLFLGISVSGLNAQVGPPPIITQQPTNRTALQGTDVAFSVSAVSSTELRYKWYFNDQNAGNGFGNGTPTFTVTNVQSDDAGIYYVEVRNSTGRLVSSNATLTVVIPTVTCSSPRMTTNGFSVQLLGPAGLSYVVLTSSNLTDWLAVSTNPAPEGIVYFTDATATNDCAFYRAMIMPSGSSLKI